METLTRLVTESLARHGFDRPVDYRRLQWSHWFRCESHHSLLLVPSKPGVFALAEEVMDLDASNVDVEATTGVETTTGMATGASPLPRTRSEAKGSGPAPEADSPRRMLAVAKFFEDDDMAFVLDRMLSHQHPMHARLASGRYFVRFVVIEDPSQRRSVCSALNQWIATSTEKATGIGSHFATSLELTPESPNVGRAATPTIAEASKNPKRCDQTRPTTSPRLNSAVPTTIHCSSSFPSGF
ncbi:MAG TPA: hypothetical protein VMG82_33835 [Candidatus Sulfotelmatobacter sp.]|nr:hypothetical protein [Candidatus Sulfotelmatobacter sp.]